MESDEAFARRLQAQEMGLSASRINDNTPLMQSTHSYAINNNNNTNSDLLNRIEGQNRMQEFNAITNRANDISTNRATVFAIIAVNFPQVLAAVIVLSLHWRDPVVVCDSAHETKWRVWATFAAVRMTVYSLIVLFMYIFKNFFDDRPRLAVQVNSFRNMIDALGLIWFVVGNMWLFGDDDNSCRHPDKSPIYGLCISMLIINYIQICLPCILAAIMIPVFCFCMPCLIRLMARLNNRAVQGATTAAIDSIPLVTLGADVTTTLQSEDLSCPICLNDMVTGDEVRLLQCNHNFHRQCVDEWLRVNASCPTCRKSVLRDAPAAENAAEQTANSTFEIQSRAASRTART